MIWKTTISKIAENKRFGFIPKLQFFSFIWILIFLGSASNLFGQTTQCDIIETECPPSDLYEPCGDVTVDDVLGNYITWTGPTYSLDCGDGNTYQYQISFDLPEGKEECWEFYKVQRVGTGSGVLNLWKSDGDASGVAEVTSPSFYMNEEVNASMDVFAETGQDFKVDVYLENSTGARSGILDSFDVIGNGALTPYAYSVDPSFFDGSGTYDQNKIFRIYFEFSALEGTNLKNSSYIEFITIDAGLFGSACAAEANFAVVSTHSPGDFFPVGTTTVTYTATCNGCAPIIVESCSFDVTVNPVPEPIITNDSSLDLSCSNPSTKLTASGGTSYQWTNSNNDDLGTNATIEVFTEDTFTVTVTTDNGCEAQSAVSTTLDNTKPTAVITGNEELTCANTEITLDASGSTFQGTPSYSWNTDSADGAQVGTSATLNVSSPGTYFVTVTDGDNGCSASTSVVVTQDITAVTGDITGNEELTCANTKITLDASASTVQGNASYEWSTGETSASIEVTQPGDYTVTVTDSDNGCSDETTVTVTQDITPVTADISGNEELTCANTEITLDASASTFQGTPSYSWNTNTADGTQVGTSATLNVSSPGTYFVTVTDGDNGCSASTSVVVTQDITAVIADISGNEELTCTNTEITLDASGSTFQGTPSYSWNTNTADGTQVGTSPTLNVSAPGTYFVTVTDGDNGCSASTSVVVTQDITAVTASITGNEELTCTNTEITLDASASTVQGNASYEWSTGETSASIEVTQPGDYTVTVTDSDNGCSDETTVTVTQDITPVVAEITGNEELTCANTEITLDASASTVQGIASYEWSTGETSASIEVTEPGDYTVTVTDSDNGCSDETTVTVTQDITPVSC